jgi:hypothetical protein
MLPIVREHCFSGSILRLQERDCFISLDFNLFVIGLHLMGAQAIPIRSFIIIPEALNIVAVV